jgi:hypothetical protein
MELAVLLPGLLSRLWNLNRNPGTQPKCPAATGAVAEGSKGKARGHPFVVPFAVPSANVLAS